MDRTAVQIASRVTSMSLLTLFVVALLVTSGCGNKTGISSGVSPNSPAGIKQIGAGEDGKIHTMQGSARSRKNKPAVPHS